MGLTGVAVHPAQHTENMMTSASNPATHLILALRILGTSTHKGH
jgi:hypothetical protein